jgi:hypothetical protein
MKLIIQTQYEENYGAHDWDGEGECPQRWKFKGGATYVVKSLPVGELLDGGAERIINELRPLIEDDNESYREYLIDWSVADDCDGDGVEEWEKPWVITRDGGSFVATRLNDMYRENFVESYTMLEKGGRMDYVN